MPITFKGKGKYPEVILIVIWKGVNIWNQKNNNRWQINKIGLLNYW